MSELHYEWPAGGIGMRGPGKISLTPERTRRSGGGTGGRILEEGSGDHNGKLVERA